MMWNERIMTNLRRSVLLVFLGVLGLGLLPSKAAQAQNTRIRAGSKRKPCRPQWRKRFKPDFRKTKVLAIVKTMARLTCYNFIVSSKLRSQTITIISEKKVSLSDYYRAFVSALAASSITMVRVGKFQKLIYARNAAQQSIRTYTRGRFRHPRRDEMVTYLLRLKYIDVYKMVNILNQLSPSVGRRLVFRQSGVIVMVDYASNIYRLLRIVRALDVQEAEERDRMFLVQVENGQAQAIVQRVQSIFQIMNLSRARAQRLRGQPVDESHRLSKILADDRTNRIILVCSNKAYLNAVRLIRKLDQPLVDGGRIRVVRLRYAKAEEISQTLSQLARGGGAVRRRRRTRRAKSSTAQAADLFRGEVRITADKSTNSLVIVSNQRDYESLMRVITKLDVRRKQIFVETVILEVSLDKTRDIGAAFHGGAITGGTATNPDVALFGTQLGGLNSIVLDPASLTGLALGLRGPDIPNSSNLLGTAGTGVSVGIPSFGVVLRAIQTNNDVDIISTPHILTAANEEASIQVGQNVPFIAGTSFAAAGLGAAFPVRNIQRQDVALNMKIKPQINAGDRIKLELDLEITEIAGQDPELGPTTTKRKVKTVVRIKDNQTVVLGGLMRDRVSEGVAKVPFLGDIPLLGALFRTKNRTVEKRNLLIFMTPHIVMTPADFRRIFRKKMKERKKFLRAFYTYKRDKIEKKLKSRPPLSRHGLIDRILHSKAFEAPSKKSVARPAKATKK